MLKAALAIGTNIATEAVVRAPADGYTLLVANVANAINATLYDKLNFNFIRDIAPIAGVVRISPIIVVNPSFAPRTVPELIAYARGNPGKVAVAVPCSPCACCGGRVVQDEERSRSGSRALCGRRTRNQGLAGW